MQLEVRHARLGKEVLCIRQHRRLLQLQLQRASRAAFEMGTLQLQGRCIGRAQALVQQASLLLRRRRRRRWRLLLLPLLLLLLLPLLALLLQAPLARTGLGWMLVGGHDRAAGAAACGSQHFNEF